MRAIVASAAWPAAALAKPTGAAPRPAFRACRAPFHRVLFAPGRRPDAALAAAAKNIVQIDAEQLNVEIENRDRPLIIDFYATWCGPCVLLAKELEEVAADLGDGVRILKLDTDANPEISTQLQIQGLPTLIFVGLDPSKPALRTEGLLPAQTIKEIVQTELGAPQ